MGHPVLTVGPPDLARYTISPRTTDVIEDAALWLSQQRDLAPDGRIGMMGISFAGGLSIVAAGASRAPRPRRLRAVVRRARRSAAHAALSLHRHPGRRRRSGRRTTTAWPSSCSAWPTASCRPTGRPLRQAILTFLEASRLDMVDKAQSAAEFERARVLAAALPEPARTLMRYVNERDVAHLGPILLPHVTALGGDPALSPALSPPPAAPVYLLHGSRRQRHPGGGIDRARRDLRRARRGGASRSRRRSSPTPRSIGPRACGTSGRWSASGRTSCRA